MTGHWNHGIGALPPDMEGIPLQVSRTCHWRKCPTCEGLGRIGFYHPRPSDDAAAYDEAPCPNPDCEDGDVTVWRDPTYRLREARRSLLRHRRSPTCNCIYGECRQDVVSPVLLPDSIDPPFVPMVKAA